MFRFLYRAIVPQYRRLADLPFPGKLSREYDFVAIARLELGARAEFDDSLLERNNYTRDEMWIETWREKERKRDAKRGCHMKIVPLRHAKYYSVSSAGKEKARYTI